MNLGARLALFFAFVAATTALIVGGASYVTTDRQVLAEVDSFLRERADQISDGQRDQPQRRSDDNRRDEDRRDDDVVVAVSPDSEVQILDESASVVSNTGLLLPVEAIDEELALRDNQSVLRTLTVEGISYRMITESLPGGGAVQVARSLEESGTILGVLRSRIIIIAGASAILAACAGWFVAQRTTRSLRALSVAVDDVAQTRDFTMPVAVVGRDEVGRLARGFNRMLDALNSSQEQQERLVQDAAHELRTPLTSMTANVDWLIRAPDLDPETRSEALEGVRRELGELNGLMSEIIELATDSREAPELVPTDLVAVSQEAAERFRQRTGRTVSVESAPVTVTGDADSLARAITNLLDNAHKYSPIESPIGVNVGPSGVYVDDAGGGIPPNERELVFDRFYRRAQDRPMSGSGLGLSIVAEIVAQHGGSVSLTASDRGGAHVGFSIPTVAS